MTEYSIRLIKGFPIVTPVDTWIDICPKDMNICPSPNLVESINLTAARVTGYIEELKNNRSSGRFLDLQVKGYENSIKFQVYLYKNIVARLCQLVPKPFIDIQFSVKYAGNARYDFLVQNRLDLTEILEASQTGQWRQLSSSGSSIRDSVDRQMLCDIFIGWTESSGDLENQTAKSTRANATALVRNLFEQESSKDLTIVVGNGAELKCHRVIFEAHSDVLVAMLSPNNGMKEFETGRIEMMENSEEGMSHFLRYLYGMDLTMDELSCDVAIELFKTAHKYKLTELEKYLGEMLMAKEGDWFGPNDILELYFHLKNLDEFKSLHEYLLSIMLGLAKEIKACDRFSELKRTDPEAAYDLVWTLFEKK